MEITDLKAGMTVGLRNHGTFRVFTNVDTMDHGPSKVFFAAIGEESWMSGDAYFTDMTFVDHEWDIVKVYGIHSNGTLLSHKTGELIWERK